MCNEVLFIVSRLIAVVLTLYKIKTAFFPDFFSPLVCRTVSWCGQETPS